jgi:hypothetical protein
MNKGDRTHFVVPSGVLPSFLNFRAGWWWKPLGISIALSSTYLLETVLRAESLPLGGFKLKDAAKDIALAKGDAYAKAVKGGLITAEKVGRVAAKAIPVAGWFSTASDVRKFASGFVTGWLMYGARKGNFDFANV